VCAEEGSGDQRRLRQRSSGVEGQGLQLKRAPSSRMLMIMGEEEANRHHLRSVLGAMRTKGLRKGRICCRRRRWK
jgi:hypothetical protein